MILNNLFEHLYDDSISQFVIFEVKMTSNVAEEARLDITARSIWNPLERLFFDVRVFHAPARLHPIGPIIQFLLCIGIMKWKRKQIIMQECWR